MVGLSGGNAQLAIPNRVLRSADRSTTWDHRKVKDEFDLDPLSRPSPRWFHSSSWLDDLAIVSWSVPLDRLAAQLPKGFEPIAWPTESGTELGLVSCVAFQDRDFRFRFWPWTQVRCGQVNYRAYVRCRGEPGVWFFGTSLDHPLVVVPRRLWRMPWHRDQVAVRASWHGQRLDRYRVHGDGPWASLSLELTGVDVDPGIHPIPTLATSESGEISAIYTDPIRGWFRRTDGKLGAYSVWHSRMRMVPANVIDARSGLFEALGLISAEQPPIDARVIREVRFEVHTPPRRLKP
jgi:uncharacterized protein YqjF (DUF2071 family)